MSFNFFLKSNELSDNYQIPTRIEFKILMFRNCEDPVDDLWRDRLKPWNNEVTKTPRVSDYTVLLARKRSGMPF